MGSSGVLSHPHVRYKKTSAPSEVAVNQCSIAAHVTRALHAHNAEMSEQAWEHRAVERLPRTPHNSLAALHHDLSEQFSARYSLREGETWEANA